MPKAFHVEAQKGWHHPGKTLMIYRARMIFRSTRIMISWIKKKGRKRQMERLPKVTSLKSWMDWWWTDEKWMTNFTKTQETSCDIQVKQVGENSCSTCNNLKTWDDCQSHEHSTAECLNSAHHRRERSWYPKPNTARKNCTKLNHRATSDSSGSAELDRAWVDGNILKIAKTGMLFFPQWNPTKHPWKNLKTLATLPQSSETGGDTDCSGRLRLTLRLACAFSAGWTLSFSLGRLRKNAGGSLEMRHDWGKRNHVNIQHHSTPKALHVEAKRIWNHEGKPGWFTEPGWFSDRHMGNHPMNQTIATEQQMKLLLTVTSLQTWRGWWWTDEKWMTKFKKHRKRLMISKQVGGIHSQLLTIYDMGWLQVTWTFNNRMSQRATS